MNDPLPSEIVATLSEEDIETYGRDARAVKITELLMDLEILTASVDFDIPDAEEMEAEDRGEVPEGTVMVPSLGRIYIRALESAAQNLQAAHALRVQIVKASEAEEERTADEEAANKKVVEETLQPPLKTPRRSSRKQ